MQLCVGWESGVAKDCKIGDNLIAQLENYNARHRNTAKVFSGLRCRVYRM